MQDLGRKKNLLTEAPDEKTKARKCICAIGIFCLFVCLPRPGAFSYADTQSTASYYTVASCLKESGQCIMANGRKLNDDKFTAANWDFPFKTKLQITNLANGKKVTVEVTDRGPAKKLYKKGRIIDLSRAAFMAIANLKQGIIPIKIVRLK